jgi:hypothetical protein
MAFVEMAHEQVLTQIPRAREGPAGWVASKTLSEVLAFFEIVVRVRLEATVVTELQKRASLG